MNIRISGCWPHLSVTHHAKLVEPHTIYWPRPFHSSPPISSKISPPQTLAADAAGRASRGGLPPPPAGRAGVPRARLPRQQALARPPHRRRLPRSLPRVPWSSPRAWLLLLQAPVLRRPAGERNRATLTLHHQIRAAHLLGCPWLGSLGCNALDCRHGLVVLGDKVGVPTGKLTVSDPITGYWRDLAPSMILIDTYGAAVLCAATGYDHRACHDGPFRVVFVGFDKFHGGTIASVWVCSPHCSEASSNFYLGEWGQVCSAFHIDDDPYIEPTCPVLVGDALYFMLVYIDDDRPGILKYDLISNLLSLIDAPLDVLDTCDATILMGMEDDSLGFAYVDDGLTLYVWSRQLASDGVASWSECKENRLTLIGTVPGRDIIFVTTDLGICEINLKTLKWKKIRKRDNFRTLLPYISFYNPEEL